MPAQEKSAAPFDSALTQAFCLRNGLRGKDQGGGRGEFADGLLAGAVQYWLYARQPCGDARCEDCLPINTAEARLSELKRLIGQLAAESEYYHAPTDVNVGRA